jgi:hypothetical protein
MSERAVQGHMTEVQTAILRRLHQQVGGTTGIDHVTAETVAGPVCRGAQFICDNLELGQQPSNGGDIRYGIGFDGCKIQAGRL